MNTILIDRHIDRLVRRTAMGGLGFVLGSVIMVAASSPAHALGTCTAAARGISSFSCPNTPTENVCGDAPNLSCYMEGNEPVCGIKKRFDCVTCSCVCDAGFVSCAGNCMPILSCPAGLVPDHCTQICTTPYVMLKTTTPPGGVFPQAGGIQVSGDIGAAGDLYLSSGKAFRVDSSAGSSFNMGNWGGGPFALNVVGTIQGSQFCIGASCITAWPGGGGGGGTVTSIAAGSGLIASPVSPITGSGTLNIGAGSGIAVGADSISIDTAYTDGRYVSLTGATMVGTLTAPTLTANTTINTPQLCLNGNCRSSWPAGGGVSSLSQGSGIVLTPSPITGTGSVGLDTAFTDARYVNASGDAMSGQLTLLDMKVNGSAGFGGYDPDGTWKISTPTAYVGAPGASTFIGSGDVTTDKKVSGSQLCIGSDCRSSWPTGGSVETDTLQSVTDRGNVTTRSVTVQNYLSVTGAGGVSANFGGGNVQVTGGYLSSSAGLIAYSGQGICATSGSSAESCMGANAPAPGYVKSTGFCLPGSNPTGGCITAWPTSGIGDITDVGAGNGLTGGGSSGAVALDVQASNGIAVISDTIQLDPNYTTGPYVRKAGDTMTGSLVISGSNNLSVGGGLNIGSGSGATAGEIQASGRFITVNSTGANSSPGLRFGPSGYPVLYYDTITGSNYLRPEVGMTVPKLTISPGGPIEVPAAANADMYMKGKAYFEISAPIGSGNRAEIGFNSSGYGLYVKNNPGAKIENSNGVTSVALADANYGVNANSTAVGTFAGNFTNGSGTGVKLASSNYGVYSEAAGTYGGVFLHRTTAAAAYLAGSNYGVYAAAPVGGYSLYGVGNAKITLDLEADSLTTNLIRLGGVDKDRWPVWDTVNRTSSIAGWGNDFDCASGEVASYTCYTSSPVAPCATYHPSAGRLRVYVPSGSTAYVRLSCQ